MTKGSVSPNELRLEANGLPQRVLEWRAHDGGRASSTVVLIHGFMDAAGTWGDVAPALAARGHRVLAPDMRGFGEGPRVAPGGYYHFVDYVADLADTLSVLEPRSPVALVGHSMGGTIATLYAGTYPEKVARLASLEGLGPPDNGWDAGPKRMRAWIDGVRAVRERGEPTPALRADARRRLVASHPAVSPDVLAQKLPHLVRELGDERVVWRFDPLHRTTSPVPFFAKLFAEFAKNVDCPVLFVSGGATGFHPADEEERLAAFRRLERATLEGAGHMLHWTQPEALATLLVDFLAAT